MNQGGGGNFGGKKWRKLMRGRNVGQDYMKGIGLNIRGLPEQLAAERRFRNQTDAQRIQAQQDLQARFGPRQARQQIQALNALDPGFSSYYSRAGQLAQRSANTPTAYENRVNADLQSGYNLPPELLQEVTNTIRGREAMSGNTQGNSSISGEAAFTGSAMNEMYQQRLRNAATGEGIHQARLGNLASFLNGNSPSAMVGGPTPVMADRSFAYVNPNAGYLGQQTGQQQFANQLGVAGIQSAGQGTGFPWGQALATAGSVASAFSDRRLKTDIRRVGRTPGGSNLYSFRYRDPQFHVGVMADEEQKKNPGAVHTHPSGYKMVDYARVQ